jgi:hypothetical protein
MTHHPKARDHFLFSRRCLPFPPAKTPFFKNVFGVLFTLVVVVRFKHLANSVRRVRDEESREVSYSAVGS